MVFGQADERAVYLIFENVSFLVLVIGSSGSTVLIVHRLSLAALIFFRSVFTLVVIIKEILW
jgi:hypothetical protein